jgi:guanyl-specific ribonuclease Sa
MPRWLTIALLLLLALAGTQWWSARGPDTPVERPAAGDAGTRHDARARYPSFLPPEAVSTLEAIERGGPFPYDRDGTVFQNREGRLPAMPRGYYREYTVVTPGSPDRGARRIVAGGQPPEVFYFTDDHYRSFRRLEIPR